MIEENLISILPREDEGLFLTLLGFEPNIYRSSKQSANNHVVDPELLTKRYITISVVLSSSARFSILFNSEKFSAIEKKKFCAQLKKIIGAKRNESESLKSLYEIPETRSADLILGDTEQIFDPTIIISLQNFSLENKVPLLLLAKSINKTAPKKPFLVASFQKTFYLLASFFYSFNFLFFLENLKKNNAYIWWLFLVLAFFGIFLNFIPQKMIRQAIHNKCGLVISPENTRTLSLWRMMGLLLGIAFFTSLTGYLADVLFSSKTAIWTCLAIAFFPLFICHRS